MCTHPYFVQPEGEPIIGLEPDQVPEGSLDDAKLERFFPDRERRERFVLGVLCRISAHYDKNTAVSWSVVDRFIYEWWYEESSRLNRELFAHLVTLGQSPLSLPLWLHVFHLFLGLDPRQRVGFATEHLIESGLIHYQAARCPDGETIHLYELTPKAWRRFAGA